MHRISDIVVESSDRSLRTRWTPHAPLVTPWRSTSKSSRSPEVGKHAVANETQAFCFSMHSQHSMLGPD